MNGTKKIIFSVIALVLLILAVAGISFVLERQATEGFLSDFNTMNGHYKQALFATGQGNRDVARMEYDLFTKTLAEFRTNYPGSGPRSIKNDPLVSGDLANIDTIRQTAQADVYDGNLSRAHTTLEGIRPLFNEVLRRNDMSLLSVVLVDFHDSMEEVMAAGDAKDAALVITRYVDADQKLSLVEAELNDTDVQNIRMQLNAMRDLAMTGAIASLPAQSTKLKTSYVKVYLAKG